MTFKPKIWFPIALVLSAVNLAAVWFAAGAGEAPHASLHAALALACGVWAQRLSHRAGATADRGALESPGVRDDLDALDGEVGTLQQQLSEMQERLDFAERMLAQRVEGRPVDPER